MRRYVGILILGLSAPLAGQPDASSRPRARELGILPTGELDAMALPIDRLREILKISNC